MAFLPKPNLQSAPIMRSMLCRGRRCRLHRQMVCRSLLNVSDVPEDEPRQRVLKMRLTRPLMRNWVADASSSLPTRRTPSEDAQSYPADPPDAVSMILTGRSGSLRGTKDE
jgi:hypothetical protein